MRFIFGLLFVLATSVAHAGDVHGILRVVKGDVQIKSASGTVKAKLGAKVFPKDIIITGKDSRAKVVMVDNNELNVSPDSQIELQNYEYDPAAGKKEVLLNVIYGKVRSKVEQKYDGKTSKFQIKTPSAVAGVRGTDFITGYNRADNSSSVVTFRGRVEFGLPGPGGTISNPVSVTPGTQAMTNGSGAPPAPPAPVDKKELAKMDHESNAETGGDKGKSDERQPADDGGKKEKKDDKKDGNKNDDKDGSKDGNAGKGDNKKEGGDKQSSNEPKSSGNGSEQGRSPAGQGSGTMIVKGVDTVDTPKTPDPITDGKNGVGPGPDGPRPDRHPDGDPNGPKPISPIGPGPVGGPIVIPPMPPTQVVIPSPAADIIHDVIAPGKGKINITVTGP
jgi:hypothetical protein